jgi:hypothetical protein
MQSISISFQFLKRRFTSLEDMNEADELMGNRSRVKTQTNGGFTYSKTLGQQLEDAETEDALKEFSFLASEGSEEGSEGSDGSDWRVDKEQLNKLTEQYKKDR